MLRHGQAKRLFKHVGGKGELPKSFTINAVHVSGGYGSAHSLHLKKGTPIRVEFSRMEQKEKKAWELPEKPGYAAVARWEGEIKRQGKKGTKEHSSAVLVNWPQKIQNLPLGGIHVPFYGVRLQTHIGNLKVKKGLVHE